MKQYIIYECEKCGIKSRNREEIMKCEATHLGLTVSEKQEWEQLKEEVRHKSAIVSSCKNEQTDKEFDDAIHELMDFEKLYGIAYISEMWELCGKKSDYA